MLKSEHRLRRSREFTSTVRKGAAARAETVVVHAVVIDEEVPARVGFVVGRAVGGAVVRNTVRRRLRHMVASRVDELPPGARVVVRALPAAAAAPRPTLAADLNGTLTTAVRRARSR